METPAISSTPSSIPNMKTDRDFLIHLEAYLSKRDGIDKLLKISRYASKLILSSSFLPETLPLHNRLKTFESSLAVSRKALRLGKFVQNLNSLRTTTSSFDSRLEFVLFHISNSAEGLYLFLDQYLWLIKSGLIVTKHSRQLQKISAFAEMIGYISNISLKIRDLKKIYREEGCLKSSIELAISKGVGYEDEAKRIVNLNEKKCLRKASVAQDLSDLVMVLADIRDGKGILSGSLLISCAGLFSGLLSTHKNWVSC